MTAVKSMDIGQILRHGVRSDLPGHLPRLCLTNMIYQLIMFVTMMKGFAPLFIDIVSCYHKKGNNRARFRQKPWKCRHGAKHEIVQSNHDLHSPALQKHLPRQRGCDDGILEPHQS